jgi:hypothetical protein
VAEWGLWPLRLPRDDSSIELVVVRNDPCHGRRGVVVGDLDLSLLQALCPLGVGDSLIWLMSRSMSDPSTPLEVGAGTEPEVLSPRRANCDAEESDETTWLDDPSRPSDDTDAATAANDLS